MYSLMGSRRRLLRCASRAFLVGLVAFAVGSTVVNVIEWRLISSSSSSSFSTSSSASSSLHSILVRRACPSCSCHCPVKSRQLPRPAECIKADSNTKDLWEIAALIREEIELRKTVARESVDRTEEATQTVKKASARYQKEALKCEACVETCERGRERNEAELVEERQLTRLWEKRARERGWRDGNRVYGQM